MTYYPKHPYNHSILILVGSKILFWVRYNYFYINLSVSISFYNVLICHGGIHISIWTTNLMYNILFCHIGYFTASITITLYFWYKNVNRLVSSVVCGQASISLTIEQQTWSFRKWKLSRDGFEKWDDTYLIL
jgi:hypothetical protein